jgi:hypothetical protein
VWQATDQRQAQEVALKLFKPGNHPSFAFREAQALTALGGPNVLRVHNADVYQDVPYIATELAALGTTADRVSDGRGVRPDLAILWTRHMLQGLAVCHAAGLLHRRRTSFFVVRILRSWVTSGWSSHSAITVRPLLPERLFTYHPRLTSITR